MGFPIREKKSVDVFRTREIFRGEFPHTKKDELLKFTTLEDKEFLLQHQDFHLSHRTREP